MTERLTTTVGINLLLCTGRITPQHFPLFTGMRATDRHGA